MIQNEMNWIEEVVRILHTIILVLDHLIKGVYG